MSSPLPFRHQLPDSSGNATAVQAPTSVELEHIQITGPADVDTKPSKAKVVSKWIKSKFNMGLAAHGSSEQNMDNNHDRDDTAVMRQQDGTSCWDNNDDENQLRGGSRRHLNPTDRELSSSSSSSESGSPKLRKPLRQASESSYGLGGIEVEIDSSCNSEDCLYRKRYLNTVWFLYKRKFLWACAFLFVWLFGILIGACGTGQCHANHGNSQSEVSALTAESGLKCNSGATDVVADDNSPAREENPTLSSPIVNPSPTFLGPNVFVFDPTMTTSEIQIQADAIFRQQQNNEMGTERYALLFQPGVYGSITDPLMIQIGYYTEVAGLGQSPQDVRILGKVEVYNRCFEADPYAAGKFIPTSNSETGLCFALNSFWRSLSNLSIQIVTPSYQDTCRATAMFWAISQAASMRRVHIEGGDLSLMDYCSNPAYASGGFIADSQIGAKIISGSQQQFLTRNSNIGQWDGSTWNQLLMGVIGAPDDSTFPDPAITTFETNPYSREKPFLYVNESGEYHVFVPSFAANTTGASWSNGASLGRDIPVSDFYVANPADSASVINEQLSAGKHLILTPGVYDIGETIVVNRADTVVLGLGLATLTAVNGAVPLKVASQPGIIVAGVTLDGGLTLSPVLLQVGELGDLLTENGDPNNPITLSDVYFRIGGPHIGKANVCLEVNSNHVLIDHTWVWRADHGVEDFDLTNGFEGDNERWATNIGLNGVIVNGNHVTATGLFVEHFQEYNLRWNGENGKVYFFQNELPYEPSQAQWTADDGTLGWAAYKVDDAVMEHELWCGGVYCYNRNNPDVVTENAFEVPSDRPGVSLNHVYTRNLSGPGTIKHIVNGIGQSVTEAEKGPFYVVKYP